MNATHGMDVAEVEDLGHFLQSRADRLNQIVQQINRAVYSIHWEGGVAVQFGQQHWPGHRARLQAAASGLHGLGQSALNNASEQAQASGVHGWNPGLALPELAGSSGWHAATSLVPSLGTVWGLYADGAGLVGGVQTIRGIADVVRGAPLRFGALDMVGVPIDAVNFLGGIWDDDPVRATEGGVGLAQTGLGIVCPPAGLFTEVAEVGIDYVLDPTNVVDGYAQRTYGGVDSMTPQQAAELTNRYRGFSGLIHVTGDGLRGRADQIADFFN